MAKNMRQMIRVIIMFEYYVLNYNWDKKCVENFNIFDNISLDNAVENFRLRQPHNFF